MRLLISGYYGFNNAGDEAVLAAMLSGLRRRFPECEPCVLSSDPGATTAQHGVAAVQRWSIREVWRALGGADVLLQGGGGLIQDATSRASSLYYLGILRMARLRRVPAMVFAQGIGPLSSAALRRLAGREFARTRAITVRDEASLRELAQMGVTHPDPVLTVDPAVLLEPRDEGVDDALCELGVDPALPRAIVTVRQWPGSDDAIAACREATRRLLEFHGMQVLVVPFQEPDDVAPAELVAQAHPQARVLRGVGDVRGLVGHIARAELVISMRLHALIFAAAQSVPAVGVAYDPKVTAFAQRARQRVVELADCTVARMRELVDETVATARLDATRRDQTAAELRETAERNFDVLSELLGRIRGS